MNNSTYLFGKVTDLAGDQGVSLVVGQGADFANEASPLPDQNLSSFFWYFVFHIKIPRSFTTQDRFITRVDDF